MCECLRLSGWVCGCLRVCVGVVVCVCVIVWGGEGGGGGVGSVWSV